MAPGDPVSREREAEQDHPSHIDQNQFHVTKVQRQENETNKVTKAMRITTIVE